MKHDTYYSSYYYFVAIGTVSTPYGSRVPSERHLLLEKACKSMNGLANLMKGIEGSFDTLQPKNTDSHEEKVIQNCITNPYKSL